VSGPIFVEEVSSFEITFLHINLSCETSVLLRLVVDISPIVQSQSEIKDKHNSDKHHVQD